MGRRKSQLEETTVTMEANGKTVTIDGNALMDKLKEIGEGKLKKKPIEIRSAIIRDGMFCNYSYDHTVAANTTNDISVKSNVPIHDDLRAIFVKLKPHLAVICEEITAAEIGDIDSLPDGDDHPLNVKINPFTVSSFRIDGTDAKEGVVLVGSKKLSTGDVLKLEAPKIKWSSGYHFINELRCTVQDCIDEVEQYMQGKQATLAQQQELNFGAEAEAAYAETDV